MEMNKLLDEYGRYTFNDETMKERIPKSTYKAFHEALDKGEPLSKEVATVIANAMKIWAVENGATHFTHWFMPMTGLTAEKHDAFLEPDGNGGAVLEFSGKTLRKGEPDASSFPSGGIRATFEARGYTAWDCTSPAFVKDGSLYIPTLFCSYTGEALDKKTPLLRSCDALSKAACRLLPLIGVEGVTKVSASVGAEQEYFLVDDKYYQERMDLKLTGRTLFGAMAPKGQELEDHYFGSLKRKVAAFMKDLDAELWKYGIPSKTKHNEVAPAQHEVACVYAKVNITTDNNHLLMQIAQDIAKKHGLRCLLHEKPFDGINGSGKHNNWSLTTDDGINLFKPGKKPEENKLFQLVLACTMAAVDRHAVLLRLAASNTGNDHRLGANEAPPAIISMYLGDQVGDIVEQILKNGKATSSLSSGTLEFGIKKLPVLEKDPTDRNRTSPFAFTGNRFEFRMVASSNSIGDTNTVLNAMMAEAFSEACDALEGAADFDKAVEEYTAKLMKEHARIVFNGNGYSEEWPIEAEKRGLPNCRSIVDAIPALVDDTTVAMYEKFNILSKAELEARKEILFEQYAGVRNIEALTMVEMSNRIIMPAVTKYTKDLADTVIAVKEAGADASVQAGLLGEISAKLAETKKATTALAEIVEEAKAKDDSKAIAISYKNDVMAAMAALRKPVDELEVIMPKEVWPMPTYGDLVYEIDK